MLRKEYEALPISGHKVLGRNGTQSNNLDTMRFS